ncbi:hypothetical protein GCM10022408_24630 [Hymenobacter fastidiosus]|uniref:HTH LytTR-type domain-containing protein n=1 Tax=Hymenobacter fastidiosus TaxID=486264 RepID=A0ABP7SG01_9BACT
MQVEYQLIWVGLSDILCVKGLRDYVKVHLHSVPRPLLSLLRVEAMEAQLPARRLLRFPRSFIVALDNIEAVRRHTVPVGPVAIVVSDQYKETFLQFLSRRASP